jgi:hypothetical protein
LDNPKNNFMKKNVTFLVVFCFCVFVSCKKKYECDCVVSGAIYMSNEPTDYQHTDVYSYKAKTKNDARSSCVNDHNKPLQIGANGLDWSQTNCDIK